MNKHTLGLVIYIKDQPQVKIKDAEFNRSSMFAVGLSPGLHPHETSPFTFLINIDMGLNRWLFNARVKKPLKSDWFNPRVDYFESITLCLPSHMREHLPHEDFGRYTVSDKYSPLEHYLALTQLYFTLRRMLKDVGVEPRTLHIKFYDTDGSLNDYTARHQLTVPLNFGGTGMTSDFITKAFMQANEDLFKTVVKTADMHYSQLFEADIPQSVLDYILVQFRGDILSFHAELHNKILNRYAHTPLIPATHIKAHYKLPVVQPDTHKQPEDMPMRPHTQQQTSPEKAVNLIVWNSDLVYRAAAQIANMRYNEITIKDSPALDWNQVLGRMVMMLTQELGNIISVLHSENLAGGIVFVPHSFNQKLKDTMNHAFGYMGLTFEEMPMNTEQLSIIKDRHHVRTLLQVYICNNGIQPPSYAGYQPAGLFDPRTYGPPPLQPFVYDPRNPLHPFQTQLMSDTEYMHPRNPVMTPFVPPHVHSPVHMPPRSPDFGGRRPSRASVDQPEYSNRMQHLHNAGMPHTTTGPAPDGTMIVGRVPLDDQPVQFGRGGQHTNNVTATTAADVLRATSDVMQQYSGEVDTHEDSGNDY